VVVLRNEDAAILAEAGGRQFYRPLVYLAAFRQGLDLDTTVPDQPIAVPMGADRPVKWIANYDNRFKGSIPVRQALAESRNAVAVWITRKIGLARVIGTSQELGIRTPLQPYITTALGASEVRLLELAGAYRAMASGILAEPYIIERVTGASGEVLFEAPRATREISSRELSLIQEGLRGVIRLPEGTAHSLHGPDFRIPVMGKIGTTTDFRDALFVGSTYGPHGITVAVRIGYDDNRALGEKETGARRPADLPRNHAACLRAKARGPGAYLPPRDRGPDRPVPGAAGCAQERPRHRPAWELRRQPPRRAAPRHAGARHQGPIAHGRAAAYGWCTRRARHA
jgi:membrane peptidoglycan carboxypeptidase